MGSGTIKMSNTHIRDRFYTKNPGKNNNLILLLSVVFDWLQDA